MKIRPVEAEMFHLDGQKDKTKLIVTFRYFTSEPKNWTYVRTYKYAFVNLTLYAPCIILQ